MSLELNIWQNSPNGKIIESDIVIVKNYLTKEELKSLEKLLNMHLDYAENQAIRKISTIMKDCKKISSLFYNLTKEKY